MLNDYFNDIKNIVLNSKRLCNYKIRLVEVSMTSECSVYITVKVGRNVFVITNNFKNDNDSYVGFVANIIYRDLKEAKYVK